MKKLYDKNSLLGLCVIACLSIVGMTCPSDDSSSTDSSASSAAGLPRRKYSLMSLESAPSEEPVAVQDSQSTRSSSSSSDHIELESVSRLSSGPTNRENQQINAERRRCWGPILQADQNAVNAQNPADKQLFEEQAQKLRDEFEAIENSRPARQEGAEEYERKVPLADVLENFEDRNRQEEEELSLD